MRLTAGSRLGPYEISGPIGAGGMGEVYRARDTRLGREVAVKVLPHAVASDPERLKRFEREARTASALNHPNIVTIHDFTSSEGEMWIVMELVRGTPLRDVIKRGALPLKDLLALAVPIADGLAAAHEGGLVHRDLKPENIMVTEEGTPKILDFGLARSGVHSVSGEAETEEKLSRTGVIVGTATYMSPEQARGEALDFRSDLFSFGLILHEMATGAHPFRRASSIDTLSAILNDDAPPLNDSLPAPFAWIVSRCLAKKPRDRYGSTRDLAHDLSRLRELPAGSSASAEAARPRFGKGAAAAVALILLAAILGFAIAGAKRGPAPRTQALSLDVTIPEVKVFLDEVILPVRLSPDGRHLAVHGMSASGTGDLWIRDLRDGTSRTIARNAIGAGWSPDGSELAYFAEGKLKAISIAGGPARTICDALPAGSVAWSGGTILFTQFAGPPDVRGMHRVDAGGGTPRQLIRADLTGANPTMPWWPVFLPDGKRFLYLNLVPSPGRPEIFHQLMIGSFDGPPQKVEGAVINSIAEFANGQLLFVRDGTLMAQPFDPEKGTLTGEARPLVDDVHYFRTTGLAAFSVSGDGLLAWRSARRPSRLVWLDREGAEVATVASALFEPDGRMSADGTRYVAGVFDETHGVSDIWIYDLARGSSERQTFNLLDERSPIWAEGDGSVYLRSDGFRGPPDIAHLNVGKNETSLFFQGPTVEEPEDISRDGRWMLYVSRAIQTSDIHALSLDGRREIRRLVTTPFNDHSPRFSPDGRWIAYVSDLSGRPEIYVRPFDGEGRTTRLSKDGGTHPRWRRDGNELYFLGPGGVVTAIDTRDGVFGPPRILFIAVDATDFEPAPDGTRFLAQIAERAGEPPMHILVNWPARLKE